MENLKKMEKLVVDVIRKYASYYESADLEEYEKQMVFDHENHHYFLMDVGWDGMKRIHYCLLHIDIKNGKIWIQKDFTHDGVATDFMEKGVPKENIVLAFQSPFKRPYTDFATA